MAARTEAAAPPRSLIVVAGPMASGKSSVARHLAQRLGAELVSADRSREDLFRQGVDEAFVPGFSEELYARILAQSRKRLRAGRAVVIDGAFRTRSRRAAARRLADEEGVPFRLVECRAPEAVCRERLARREAAEGRPGWLAMYEAFLKGWEPILELAPEEHCVVDSSGPEEQLESLELDFERGVPR